MQKIKLIERIDINIKRDNVVLEEKKQLIEANGQSYESGVTLRNVPISRYTENQNSRIYSRILWERVARSKIFEGSYCLADHKEDPSVNDIVGIWNNFKVNEQTSNADLTLIGDKGKLFYELVKNNGKCGLSTVGYGELKEDDKTVDPNSYEYEHTDWVISPSQGVYATSENLEQPIDPKQPDVHEVKVNNNVTSDQLNTAESVQNNNNLNEQITNNITNIEKLNENIQRGNNMNDVIMEKVLKNQTDIILEEVSKSTDYKASLNKLEEAKKGLPSEMTELVSKIDSKIDDVKTKIQETIKSKDLALEEIQLKYDASVKTLEEMTKRYNEAKVLLEKSGEAQEIKELKEDIFNAEKDIKAYEEDLFLAEKDISKFEEDRKNMIDDLEKFKVRYERVLKERKTMKEHIIKCEDLLEKEFNFKFEEDEMFDPSVPSSDEMDTSEEEHDMTGNEKIDDMLAPSFIDTSESIPTTESIEVNSDFAFPITEEDDSDEDEDKEDDKEDKEDKMDEKKQVTKKIVKESKEKDNWLEKSLKEFFEEASKKTPSIKKIEKEILTSNSIFQATQLVEAYRSQDKKLFKIDERGYAEVGTKQYRFPD